MKTPKQIADGRLKPAGGEPWTEGTFTLYLGSRTVYNISAKHAEVLREAMIRAVEVDRAQRPATLSTDLTVAARAAVREWRGSRTARYRGDRLADLLDELTDSYEALAAEHDGTLHAATITALRERGESWDGHPSPTAAIDWIEAEPDEFWEEFAGPMLDDIERKFRP